MCGYILVHCIYIYNDIMIDSDDDMCYFWLNLISLLVACL